MALQEDVLAQIKKGDQKAFKMFFDFHYQPLCAYLRSFTADSDAAEELAQMTFVALWKKRESLEIHTSFKSYLYKMGYRFFLLSLRQKNKQAGLLEDLKYQALQDSYEETETNRQDNTTRLKVIVGQLPPRCQEVLRLKLEGLKYQEIAETLGLSVKTVESQMRIAFKKIKEGFKGSLLFFICRLR